MYEFGDVARWDDIDCDVDLIYESSFPGVCLRSLIVVLQFEIYFLIDRFFLTIFYILIKK